MATQHSGAVSAKASESSGTDRAVEPIEPDQSLGELFGRLGEDLSQLVSSQIELARTELKDEAKQAGQTAGFFGAGAIVGYLALTLLCFAAAWGLAAIMPTGFAFLIVAVIVGIAAGVMMMLGKKRMDEAKEIAPQTVQTLKEDAEWTREQMR